MAKRFEGLGIRVLAFVFASFAGTTGARADAFDVVPVNWTLIGSQRPTDSASTAIAELVKTSNRYSLDTYFHAVAGASTNPPGAATYFDLECSDPVCKDPFRAAGSHAFALAVALKTGIYDPAVAGASAATATATAVKFAASVAHEHISNRRAGLWGEPHWQSGAWASYAGMAGWLLWDSMNTTDREYVRQMLEFECNKLKDKAVPCFKDRAGNLKSVGDSKYEENQWNANALQLCLAMMPNHPQKPYWMDQMLAYSYSSLGRQAAADEANPDVTSSAPHHGRSLKTWLRGTNLNSDGTVTNHSINIHPDYMTFRAFGSAMFGLARLKTPAGLTFNMDRIYYAFTDIDFQNVPNPGLIYRDVGPSEFLDMIHDPYKNDWGISLWDFLPSDTSASIFGLDARSSGRPATCRTNPAACWEELHAQGLRSMQARYTDGRTFCPGLPVCPKAEFKHPAGEADIALTYAQTYLMKWLNHNRPFTDSANLDPLTTSYLPVRQALRPGWYNGDDLNVDMGSPLTTPWLVWNNADAYNGDFVYADVANATWKFTFEGTGVSVRGFKQSDGGKATITVDGNSRQLDFFAGPETHEVDGLAPGTHTVTVKVLGTHSSGSTGNTVNLDKIEVRGVLPAGTYDDRHPYLSYWRGETFEYYFEREDDYWAYGLANWRNQARASSYQGGFSYSASTWHTFEFKFTGSRARVYGLTAPDGGQFDVWVDGVKQSTTYSAYTPTVVQDKIYDTDWNPMTAKSVHTVQIVLTGTHVSSSQGNFVMIDKVVVDN